MFENVVRKWAGKLREYFVTEGTLYNAVWKYCFKLFMEASDLSGHNIHKLFSNICYYIDCIAFWIAKRPDHNLNDQCVSLANIYLGWINNVFFCMNSAYNQTYENDIWKKWRRPSVWLLLAWLADVHDIECGWEYILEVTIKPILAMIN